MACANTVRSLCVAAVVGMLAVPAVAAEYEIKMLNRDDAGHSFVFQPNFLKIAPGDIVHFNAVNPGHDAQSIPGMIPDGAEPFASGMNKSIDVTFTVPGVYGFKCKPHYPVGMVGLIVVGDDPSNVAAAKDVKHVGKAKTNFEALFAEAGL